MELCYPLPTYLSMRLCSVGRLFTSKRPDFNQNQRLTASLDASMQQAQYREDQTSQQSCRASSLITTRRWIRRGNHSLLVMNPPHWFILALGVVLPMMNEADLKRFKRSLVSVLDITIDLRRVSSLSVALFPFFFACGKNLIRASIHITRYLSRPARKVCIGSGGVAPYGPLGLDPQGYDHVPFTCSTHIGC